MRMLWICVAITACANTEQRVEVTQSNELDVVALQIDRYDSTYELRGVTSNDAEVAWFRRTIDPLVGSEITIAVAGEEPVHLVTSDVQLVRLPAYTGATQQFLALDAVRRALAAEGIVPELEVSGDSAALTCSTCPAFSLGRTVCCVAARVCCTW